MNRSAIPSRQVPVSVGSSSSGGGRMLQSTNPVNVVDNETTFASNDAIGGSWILPTHEQYDLICHQLRLAITDGRIPTDIEIWQIEGAEFAHNYKKRTANMLKLVSWSSPELLEANNSVRNICSRGYFQFPSQGLMEFATGIVDLPNSNKQPNKPLTLLFSEIAVGRSFVVDNITQCGAAGNTLPQGYDSYYLTEKPLDRNNDGEFSLAEYQAAASFDHRDPRLYRHKYVFTDPSLILPKYVVRFQLPPKSTFLPSNSPKKNIRPQSNVSSTIGPLHSSTPEENNTMNSLITEYFDMTNFRPLSRLQKDACNETEVRIYTIDDAYEKASVELAYIDPLVHGKLEWIEKQLDNIDERVRKVNVNYADVADRLQEAYQRAMQRLHSITRNKLEILLSAEIELRRQKEQLEWTQSFSESVLKESEDVITGRVGGSASYQERKEAKLNLLKVWKCQVSLRNDLSRLRDSKPHTKAMNAVQADINVIIQLDVFEGNASNVNSNSTVNQIKFSNNGNDYISNNGSNERVVPNDFANYSDEESDGEDNGSSNNCISPESSLEELKSYLNQSTFNNPSASQFENSSINKSVSFGIGSVQLSAYHKFVDSQTRKIKTILAEKVSKIQSIQNSEQSSQQVAHVPLPSSVFCTSGVLGSMYHIDLPSAVAVSANSNGTNDNNVGNNSTNDAFRRVYVDPKALFKDVIKQALDPTYASTAYLVDRSRQLPTPKHTPTRDAHLRRDHADQSGDEDDAHESQSQAQAHTMSGGSPSSTSRGAPVRRAPPKAGAKQVTRPRANSNASSVADSIASSQHSGVSDDVPSKQASSMLEKKPDRLKTFVKSLIGFKSGGQSKDVPAKAGGSVTGSTASKQLQQRKPLKYGSGSDAGSVSGHSTASSSVGYNRQKHQSKRPIAHRKAPHTPLDPIEEGSVDNTTDNHSQRRPREEHLLGDDVSHVEEELEGADVYDSALYDDVDNHSVNTYFLPMITLRKLAANYPQLSMKQLAERKLTQLMSRHISGFEEYILELSQNSNILAASEAQTLYFTLPFLSKPPRVSMLYSSALHPRSLKEMYTRIVPHRGPCVMIIRSVDYVFGVYSSHPIILSGDWSGGSACFLFSLTLDLKIPYHARSLPEELGNEMLAFLAERDLLTFGNHDLVIGNSLREAECDLEHVFGLGLPVDSPEAACLLAGSGRFVIDELEVWSVSV